MTITPQLIHPVIGQYHVREPPHFYRVAEYLPGWTFNLDPITFSVELYGIRREYTVPPYFICNRASVPSWLWPIVGHPDSPQWDRGGRVHDYLYWTGKATREISDEILRQVTVQDGLNPFLARSAQVAVRTLASGHYRRTIERGDHFQILPIDQVYRVAPVHS